MGESILITVAGEVGTPVYVYDAAEIRARYRRLSAAFGTTPHRVFYSAKANSNLAVLGVLHALEAGVDIVSGGELARAMRVGFAPRDIVFSGVGKTAAELTQAVRTGVGLVNVESAGELRLLEEIACRERRTVQLGIRVNPDVTANTHPYTRTGEKGMKFGVPLDEVREMARWASDRAAFRLLSVGMHIGSQILEVAHYREGAVKLARLIDDLRSDGIDMLESVGVGGGLGIRYTDEPEVTFEAFAAAVRPLAEHTGLPLVVEPGRSLVGPAGVLLTRCLYRKHSGGKDFAIVDAGMSDLLRPALYGAVHAMDVVETAGTATAAGGDGRVDVVGPICETGDFLGLARHVPGVEPGALIAVRDVGAYGFSMSSTYNSRPRPPEVLVDGDRWAVVRERESVDDLLRGERTIELVEWNE